MVILKHYFKELTVAKKYVKITPRIQAFIIAITYVYSTIEQYKLLLQSVDICLIVLNTPACFYSL